MQELLESEVADLKAEMTMLSRDYGVRNDSNLAEFLGEHPDLFGLLRQARQKIREYFERGVRMVWVVDPEDRTAMVYRSSDEGRLLHEKAVLAGEEVVPEFSCPVAELFT